MAKLIFTGEKFQGRVYDLNLAKTTVGRGENNTLVLHDPSVSHTHCEILVHGNEVIVRDLGSKNGTFVRGTGLHHQQRPLHHGDIVRFGEVQARLELDESSDTDSATDFTAVHEHARFLRERQAGKLKTPANPSLELGAAPDDSTADCTVAVSPLPQAHPKEKAESSAETPPPAQWRAGMPWVLVAVALMVAVGLALWLLLGNH